MAVAHTPGVIQSTGEVSMNTTRPDTEGTESIRMFLTAEEVGRQLGLRKSRVYELAACGMLPVVRMGRRMWFARRGLEELAEAAIQRAKTEVVARPGHSAR